MPAIIIFAKFCMQVEYIKC